MGEETRKAVRDGGRELERLARWEESCSEEMSCRSSLISARSSVYTVGACATIKLA